MRRVAGAVRRRIREARLKARLVKALDPDLVKFVVVSAPRTGSNLFCRLMTSHPQVICFHEVFHKKAIFYGSPGNTSEFDFGGREERDSDPASFLQKLYSVGHGYPAIGMKLFAGHNDTVLHALIGMRNIRKIVLTRRNMLASFTSDLLAKRTGTYQSMKSTADTSSSQVQVDADEFRQFVDGRRRFFADVGSRLDGQEYLELDYLDVARNTRQFWDVQEFLGVEFSQGLRSNLQRQSAGGLRERIVNFDALAEELSNSTYAQYLSNEELEQTA